VKLRKPGARTALQRSSAKEAVDNEGAEVGVESVEAVESVDQVDRFEVGAQGGGRPDEEEDADAEEAQRLYAEALEDPALAKAVTLPVMIGAEALPSNVEASLKGVLALVDTEEESA